MSARLLERLLGGLIKQGQLAITYADGRKVAFGTPREGVPDIALRFTDGKVARDIVTDPRLGAAEAFMDGRMVIEQGDVMDFISLVQGNRPFEKGIFLRSPGVLKRFGDRAKHLYRSFNKPGSSKKNVAHHYDIGNDLYRLMLDPEHMQYSCAYWPREDMTLAEAQEAKLAHIAAKLALSPGQRVLDIGCGWGGMAIFLAKAAQVEVLGITLSEEQLALARERAEAAGVTDRVSFELVDYRLLAERNETFDRIVSVGMFEHVGVPQFETFFRTCANLLTADGVMLMHTIGRLGEPSFTDSFTDKHVFPGGYIPALSETVAASEKVRLAITDVEVLRFHYARTLREWYKRVVDQREAIIEMFDQRFYNMWTFYLAGATSSFENGGMCNFQIQYSRNRHTLPVTRDYMVEAESRLLG